MGSVWSRIQVELLHRHRWKARVELANAIFEYLEVFHNPQTAPRSLGVLTPMQFEWSRGDGRAPRRRSWSRGRVPWEHRFAGCWRRTATHQST